MSVLDPTPFILRELLARGEMTDADVARAKAHSAHSGGSVIDALTTLSLVTPRQLAIARAKICEHPFVDLERYEIDAAGATLLPRSTAERLLAFPLFVVDGVATVAIEDPLNLQAIDEIRQAMRLEVDPVLCETPRLRALIARAYSIARTLDLPAEVDAPEALVSGDEPIVQAVSQILIGAAEAGASDVHINPDEGSLHLRYRVDGVLQPQQAPGLGVHAGIVQRLKVLAQLDLTQTRKPQDGKFRFVHRGTPIDIRLSIIPTVHGENVVMRLLRPGAALGGLSDLNMPAGVREWFADVIRRPHGMVLVTGPTGSGKTTTLYTALAAINAPELNIVTIEDPVEIRLPLIRQVQVASEVGLTFASALRSILRQDPDVILVGEVRDEETARIAVQSALTGHLVFSTLHTNDAVGTIARLRDLGVPAFAVNGALLGVVAQRLLRRVCGQCCVETAPDEGQAAALGISPGEVGLVVGTGCAACGATGYRGRAGVFEALRVTPAMRGLIESHAPEGELLAQSRRDGGRGLLDHGVELVRGRVTTVAEAHRLLATLDAERCGEFGGPRAAQGAPIADGAGGASAHGLLRRSA